MASGIITIPCEVCGVNTSGPDQYQQHLLGKMHKKNLAKDGKHETTETYKCDVCKLECSGLIPWQQHLQGKNHAKHYHKAMLEIGLQREGPAPNLYPSLDQFSEPEASPHKCSECNIICSGVESLITHIEGKKHARQVKMLQFHKNNFAPPMSGDNMNQNLEDPHSNNSVQNGTSALVDVSDDSIRESDTCSQEYPENAIQHLVDISDDRIHENQKYPAQSEYNHCSRSDVNAHEHQDSAKLETEQVKFKCPDCDITCTGPESYMQHMKGKQHAKKMKVIQFYQTQAASNEVVQASVDVVGSVVEDSRYQETFTSTVKDSEAVKADNTDTQNVGDNVEMPNEEEEVENNDAAKGKKQKIKNIFKKKAKKTPCEA